MRGGWAQSKAPTLSIWIQTPCLAPMGWTRAELDCWQQVSPIRLPLGGNLQSLCTEGLKVAARQTVIYELLCYWKYWEPAGPIAHCLTQETKIYPHQARSTSDNSPSHLLSAISLHFILLFYPLLSLYLLSFLQSSLRTAIPLFPSSPHSGP